jgi:hypothetical protein
MGRQSSSRAACVATGLKGPFPDRGPQCASPTTTPAAVPRPSRAPSRCLTGALDSCLCLWLWLCGCGYGRGRGCNGNYARVCGGGVWAGGVRVAAGRARHAGDILPNLHHVRQCLTQPATVNHSLGRAGLTPLVGCVDPVSLLFTLEVILFTFTVMTPFTYRR